MSKRDDGAPKGKRPLRIEEQPQDYPLSKRGPKRPASVVPLHEQAGRMPPQAVDVEQAVLGRCLFDPAYAADFIPLVSAETFYEPRHQRIFTALQTLFEAGEPIDLITLSDTLKRHDAYEQIGGYYLSELTTRSGGASSAGYAARVLLEHQLRRNQIAVLTQAVGRAYDLTEDVIDSHERAEADLVHAFTGLRPKGLLSIPADVTEGILHELRARNAGEGPGIDTGFARLNTMLGGGWQPGQHYVWIAATGTGKTHLGLAFARAASYLPADGGQGLPVIYLTVEMNAKRISQRNLIADSGVSPFRVQSRALTEEDWAAIHHARQRLDRSLMMIEDRPRLHITQAEVSIRRAVRYKGARLVIVDYLQRMGYDGIEFQYERGMSLISATLKAIAEEMEVPVITFSQITGEAQEACKKGIRPGKGDARGSRDIENDADFIGGIYRPDNHGLEYDEATGRHTGNFAEIYGAKGRDVQVSRFIVGWDRHCPRFVDGEPPQLGQPVVQGEMFPDAPF